METKIDWALVKRSIAGAAFALLLAGTAAAQVTSRASIPGGALPDGDALDPTLSVDGRHVAYFWYPNFGTSDVYMADTVTGAIERISVNSSEVGGNGYSYSPSLTPDLHYVAFSSYATNLVAGDTNGPYPLGHDVFVRDRQLGTTQRVSVGPLGVQGNDMSYQPVISADGRYVAFLSIATNLVAGDTNGVEDIFVHDRTSATTERISVGPGGAEADAACWYPSISADGRWVAFYGSASTLVAGDANGGSDAFLRDRLNGTTELLSLDSSGVQGNGPSDSAVLTPDARYVVFRSVATNLVPGDTNGMADVFLRDRQTGTTERVSIGTGGVEGDAESYMPALSADGRFVVFGSAATNLVAGDTNGRRDVFVRDRLQGTTQRVSVDSDGVQGSAHSGAIGTAISADGHSVAFDTQSRFVTGDTNNWHDVYVRDRRYVPMTSTCEPGIDGVMPCPCANPPSGPGRGCDNAAATGGASLSAAGIAHLSQDSLVLTASGTGATAPCIVLQGNALLATGTVFGQGVRCADGTLVRLYTKTASGGSITAPDLGAGEPTISQRSAALGNPILPGQSRWYVVYYRAPVVLGGCPPGSTFNATQTGSVVWLP